jgi:predicted DNA-binding antitoxin AbrB/MazE fold protein
MSIIIEAVYEAGVLKPLSPLLDLKEHEKVRLTVEALDSAKDESSVIDGQRRARIRIDPRIAREIGDTHQYDLTES